MGQTNLIRTEFCPVELITSSLDSPQQTMAFTDYFNYGDTVDIVAMDGNSCCFIGAPLATGLTVSGIVDCESLVFDVSVDTSTALPAGATGWYAVAKNIDDGQAAIDRLYRRLGCGSEAKKFQICQMIVDSVSAFPSAGQTTLYVPDIDLFRAGDDVTISCSGEAVMTNTALILSVNANADEANNLSSIVIDESLDLAGHINCQICSNSLTIVNIVERLKENIDKIDDPVENEFISIGNCDDTVFQTDNLFLQGTSKLLLDGRRLRLGTAGTRAAYVHGAGNAELTFTSMVLGTNGNDIKVEIVSAPGTAVTVTGDFDANTQKVSVNNNSGTATAEQIADAINADASAQKLVQVQFGGDGTGTPAALAATNLAGGMNDGTGDYAELPPIINNEITLTGYQWLSLWILPDDRNRLSVPPIDSEELVVDYRKALTNA